MVAARATHVYRQDAAQSGHMLTPQDREKLLKPYLPAVKTSQSSKPPRRKSVRVFLRSQIHLCVFHILHSIFSLYVRIRQAYHLVLDRILAILYYHHRAPELIRQDIQALNRVPNHLSIILELKIENRGSAAIENLLDEVAEISTWCACAGISMLSIYERTGALKDRLPLTYRAVNRKFQAYFGNQTPTLQVQAPHVPSYLDGDDAGQVDEHAHQGHLSILLLSSEDGRSTLVDLTKTLAEMAQRKKLATEDITLDLIDAEITESVMAEPDLLISFAPYIELQGYPPWQIRLTEIFHAPDNLGVGYQVFLRALHNFAKAQMRFGR